MVAEICKALTPTKVDSGEKRISACKIKSHPRYSSTRTSNDIALIKLCEEAGTESSEVIDTIGLPKPHLDLSSIDDVTVAGWGRTWEDGRTSRDECRDLEKTYKTSFIPKN